MTCVELAPISDCYFDKADLGPFPVTIDRTLATSVGMPRLYVGNSDGVASPDDLLRHSLAGKIETIRVDASGRRSESTRLCRDVGDDEYQFAQYATWGGFREAIRKAS